jgi:hypothetical protein
MQNSGGFAMLMAPACQINTTTWQPLVLVSGSATSIL